MGISFAICVGQESARLLSNRESKNRKLQAASGFVKGIGLHIFRGSDEKDALVKGNREAKDID